MIEANLPIPDDTWPESWRDAYQYDKEELDCPDVSSPYGDLYRRRTKLLQEAISAYVSPGSTVLDVAAAQGTFTNALVRRGYSVTWNDIRSELAGYVALKIGNHAIRYLPGNIFELSPQQHDAVLALEIIEHVAHPDQFLNCLASFVAPGGYLFMSTPNGSYLRASGHVFSHCIDPTEFENKQFAPNADGHIFLFGLAELERLLQTSGFQIVRAQHFGNPLLAGHCGLRFVHRAFGSGPGSCLESFIGALPPSIQQHLMSGLLVVARRKESQ